MGVTQGSQGLALGLAMTAAPQLVDSGLSAATKQENKNENARRDSQEPKNDVSDLAFLIAQLRHIDFPPWRHHWQDECHLKSQT